MPDTGCGCSITAAGNVLPYLRRITDLLRGGLLLLGFNSGLGRSLPAAEGWVQSAGCSQVPPCWDPAAAVLSLLGRAAGQGTAELFVWSNV